MKNRTIRILASLMLLMTFVTGQVIVFAHNHRAEQAAYGLSAKKNSSITTDTKCPVCDQHNHVQLFLQTQIFCFFDNTSIYQQVGYAAIYQSIELLLSGNRGPPTV